MPVSIPDSHPFQFPIYTRLLVSPQDPGSRQAAVAPVEEPSAALPIVGHHDLPAEPPALQDDDFYIKIEFKKVRLIRVGSS